MYNITNKKIKCNIAYILNNEAKEENNCDIVFLTRDEFNAKEKSLLAENILEGRIILWRINSLFIFLTELGNKNVLECVEIRNKILLFFK